jgi:hypothetical protein
MPLRLKSRLVSQQKNHNIRKSNGLTDHLRIDDIADADHPACLAVSLLPLLLLTTTTKTSSALLPLPPDTAAKQTKVKRSS